MNSEQEPVVERLRQADARSVASMSSIDPAALASRVGQRRLARSRRRTTAVAGVATMGVLALVTTAALNRSVDTHPRVAAVPSPSDAEIVALLDREYQARSIALQDQLDELVRLEQENEQMQRLLNERQALDARIQQLTQMSHRLKEIELDTIRGELSQSVLDNSSDPIILGF